MKTVGERIRQAREARRLSGEWLAQKVGYKNQSAIGNLENRAGAGGGRNLGKIAAALNVSAEWLLNGPDSAAVPFLPPKAGDYYPPLAPVPPGSGIESPPPAEYDPLIREATQLLRSMSAAGRHEAIRYLRFMAEQHGASHSAGDPHPPTGKQRDLPPHPKAA